jgi:hypothetical protein
VDVQTADHVAAADHLKLAGDPAVAGVRRMADPVPRGERMGAGGHHREAVTRRHLADPPPESGEGPAGLAKSGQGGVATSTWGSSISRWMSPDKFSRHESKKLLMRERAKSHFFEIIHKIYSSIPKR